MNKKRNNTLTVMGYILFFMTIAVTVTIALSIYESVRIANGGNTSGIALIMLGVIVVLSALCTIMDAIRRKIMVERPVRKILDATRKMASGDFSVRLEATHAYEEYDSYDLIMENLNGLALSLQKSEMLKSDFISNVSHEIKTPLSIIQSYAMLLKKDNLDSDTRKKNLDTLLSATVRLSDLVGNILKLNKLENQDFTPEKEDINLEKLLEESVIFFENRIEEKNITLEVEIEPVVIFSSLACVEIIVNNLLSNAVKFTNEGGTVSVKLYKKGNDVVLSISDTGCGISKETGARIFDKFYQGDTSHAGEGNGLGLALVKKVIDVLGGEIQVESEPLKGSTFTVTLKGN